MGGVSENGYTPSVARCRVGYVNELLHRGGTKPDEYAAEFDRMIEAVRAEDREKAAKKSVALQMVIDQIEREVQDFDLSDNEAMTRIEHILEAAREARR